MDKAYKRRTEFRNFEQLKLKQYKTKIQQQLQQQEQRHQSNLANAKWEQAQQSIEERTQCGHAMQEQQQQELEQQQQAEYKPKKATLQSECRIENCGNYKKQYACATVACNSTMDDTNTNGNVEAAPSKQQTYAMQQRPHELTTTTTAATSMKLTMTTTRTTKRIPQLYAERLPAAYAATTPTATPTASCINSYTVYRTMAANNNTTATITTNTIICNAASTSSALLKRKLQLRHLLRQVGHNFDARGMLYMTLIILIYCCILLRATTNANATVPANGQPGTPVTASASDDIQPTTTAAAPQERTKLIAIDDAANGSVRHTNSTDSEQRQDSESEAEEEEEQEQSRMHDNNAAAIVAVVVGSFNASKSRNKFNNTNSNNNYNNMSKRSYTLIGIETDTGHASAGIEVHGQAGAGNGSNAAAHVVAENATKWMDMEAGRESDVVSPQHSNRPVVRLQRLFKRDAANVPENEEDDSSYHDDEFDEYDTLIKNKSAKGKYIGAPCNDMKCEPHLLHVTCDKDTQICGCERNYPVQLGLTKGCAKPKKLGEQCFYDETCIYNDENSLCMQVRHNALCQCANGYHSVSYTKPTRRVFCTQDLSELNSDLPTLLGVTTGIAVLAGLICMVLHLFSKTKYPRHRNFGDANLPPPIMYSSETGIPLTVQSGRPSSRSSLRSSGSIGSYGNRRSSVGGAAGYSGRIGGDSSSGGPGGGGGGGGGGGAGGSKGILVSTSRTGSRRPSLASVHSTSSSVRSYSMMRFEKEAQQKEIRQEMKLRLARLQQQQQLNQNRPQIIIGDTLIQHNPLSRIIMATPSPLTPNSLDELLPAVDEAQEYPLKPDMPAPLTAMAKGNAGHIAAATLNSIQNVASTSAAAAAAAAALHQANSKMPATPIKFQTNTSTTAAPAASTITPMQLEEAGAAGAYIGPCSTSTEAL